MKMKIRPLFLAAALLSLSVCSCDPVIPPPFYIADLYLSSDSCANFLNIGLMLLLQNTAEKKFRELNFSFSVTDSRGEAFPAHGLNRFRFLADVDIDAGEMETVAIALEECLHRYPEGGIRICEFYISRIVFDDGTSWSDRYSLFGFYPEVSG